MGPALRAFLGVAATEGGEAKGDAADRCAADRGAAVRGAADRGAADRGKAEEGATNGGAAEAFGARDLAAAAERLMDGSSAHSGLAAGNPPGGLGANKRTVHYLFSVRNMFFALGGYWPVSTPSGRF